MPYFSKDNPNPRVQRRTNDHVWLQEDAYEYVPPAADVLYVHPTTERSDDERGAKRRRIAAIANAYENGKPPHILTAALKGPFDSNWKNPWKDENQKEDRLLVSRLRAMLQEQREEAEAARIAQIEKKKRRRQDRLQRTLRAKELQEDGLGQSPTLPVDLTSDRMRRTMELPPEARRSNSVKGISGKDGDSRGEGWLRRQRSRSDVLKSSAPVEESTCSLPIRSSQVDAEDCTDSRLKISPEGATVRESAGSNLQPATKHVSRRELDSSPTKIDAPLKSSLSAQQMADSSFSLERIPSSRPEKEPHAQQQGRVPNPSKLPNGVPSHFAVAYQHATPTAGSSPGFAYRRVGTGKDVDVSDQSEVLVPGTEPKGTQGRLRKSRPASMNASIMARKSYEQMMGSKGGGTYTSDEEVASHRPLSGRKDRTDSYSRTGSNAQNAQLANGFTISNEQGSTQAAMLEVHGAFQEALVSLERIPLTGQDETCTTPDQGIPEVVDTVTPFRDFHLRARSRSPASRADFIIERKNDINTQDLLAAVSPFQGTVAKGCEAGSPRRKLLLADGSGASKRSHWSSDFNASPHRGAASSASRKDRNNLHRTSDYRSTTPHSGRPPTPSSPSSEFSLTSPTDKARAMTFEEGQKLLSHDSVDVEANLDAIGSFLESWDVDKAPSLAKGTPRDSSRPGGTQRSRHGFSDGRVV